VVAVPARDEEERIAACLRALAGQEGVQAGCFEVVLVLDHCRDATRAAALAAAAELPGLRLVVLDCEVPGAGHARRVGMGFACERLLGAGVPDGLIATTDADSRVAPDWLAVQLALAAAGARAIGGRIDLDPQEAASLAPGVLDARREQARVRRAGLGPGSGAAAEHHQFSGASLAVTARTYLEVGGLPAGEALEDEGLQRALEDGGIPIVRSDRVAVTTSARTVGRASRGLAHDLALADWRVRRSFRAGDFALGAVLERRPGPVSVVLPTREAAATIGGILDALAALGEAGLIDEILVVDSASGDATAEIAAARGAAVHQADDLLAEHGPSRGRGDAIWRGVSAAAGELVVLLDAGAGDVTGEMVVGLLGALLAEPGIRFVKGAAPPGEAGRLSELVARPLLNLHAPHLAGFDQPLAGEVAAEAALLRALPFPAGEGVELANLIDAAALAGTDALAQVDLGGRRRPRRALRDLSAVSYAVMVAAAARLPAPGRAATAAPGRIVLPPGAGPAAREVAILERPPLDSLAAGGRAREPVRVLAARRADGRR
jgi:glycosyltransferase involved in cell wall biosynthesis